MCLLIDLGAELKVTNTEYRPQSTTTFVSVTVSTKTRVPAHGAHLLSHSSVLHIWFPTNVLLCLTVEKIIIFWREPEKGQL